MKVLCLFIFLHYLCKDIENTGNLSWNTENIISHEYRQKNMQKCEDTRHEPCPHLCRGHAAEQGVSTGHTTQTTVVCAWQRHIPYPWQTSESGEPGGGHRPQHLFRAMDGCQQGRRPPGDDIRQTVSKVDSRTDAERWGRGRSLPTACFSRHHPYPSRQCRRLPSGLGYGETVDYEEGSGMLRCG